MKLESILQVIFTRTSAKRRPRAAAKPAVRFRRPNLHLEQLEDRTLLTGPGDYGKLPLSFEPNVRQFDDRVDFLARSGGTAIFLSPTAAVLSIAHPTSEIGVALQMQLVGGNAAAHSEAAGQLPGKVNYFKGNDPTQWQTDIATFSQVEYDEVYAGIDLVYRGNHGQLEYDFAVAPGADPGTIALKFEGADSIEIDPQGDLILHTAAGDVVQQKPFAYQDTGTTRREIPSAYVIQDGNVRFQLGSYDPSLPLVIDPLVLGYSTFLGGSNTDIGNAIAVDASGNAYVTGEVRSPDFPTTLGAFDATYNGSPNNISDVFVAKLNASGSALLYSTFIGGSGVSSVVASEIGNGIAVDSGGNAYVTGGTSSPDFPVTPGAFDTTYGGSGDAFVLKLNASGSALVYSTYLGGFANDLGYAIAVDDTGTAYVVGHTTAGSVPVTPGAFSAGFIRIDGFVTALNPAGTGLVYSATIGGSQNDFATGVDVDSSGTAYVSGYTFSSDFPTTPGAFDTTFNGGNDAFVLKVNPGGSTLAYATFLGGTGGEIAWAIAADGAGNAYVTGVTSSANFPTTPGAFDTTHGGIGNTDGFVTKLNPSGNGLVYSAFLGGANVDNDFGIAVDGLGNAYVTGDTASTDFPTTPCAFDTTFASRDAFITKINASGAALDYSGSIGAGATGKGIALDLAGNAYVTGSTTSSAFPTTPGTIDTTYNGGGDAFVAKVVDDATIPGPSCGSNTPPSNVALNLNSSVNENGTATLTGSFTDPDAADMHTVAINWGPGEGATTLNLVAGVTTFSATHTYLDDGPAGTPSDIYAINVTVSDASADTSGSTSLTVNDLPPTAGISGPSSGLSGDSLVFTLTAIDPSPADQDAGFTFRIDWDGDGVIDEMFTGPSGMTIAHIYSTPAFHNVRVTAEDKDTGVSDAATIAVDVFAPPTIQGLVWVDSNNDGEVNFGETAVPGVTITLTGIDDLGQSFERVAQTDENGVYMFTNLRPSNAAGYTIAETQPAGFPDGQDILGTVNGVPVGTSAVNDMFSGIVLSQGGLLAENYNFGERPAPSGSVGAGQTATIGYWQNRNGQNLIQSLNGGPSATQLGHWLAVTFPNMYEALDGMTNAAVAGFYKTLFARTSKSAPGGPPKTDAQVLATAFAVYVTNQTLAGTTAVAYGFQVSATGVGMRTFNVGNNGAAFGAANHSHVSVMDLLLAVNARSRHGLLYDQNVDGHISGSEAGYRTMANDVFSSINEAGDI